MEKGKSEARIVVSIAPDRMGALVSVRAGAPAGEKELREALERAGVRAGILEETAARVALGLHDTRYELSREWIARGQPAVAGENGRFESPFLGGLRPGHLREDGTLDFHDREALKPVEKDEVIGHVVFARPGVAGFLVDGTPLPAPDVKEARLELGPGVVGDLQGVVRARRSGVVMCSSEESVDVVDEHVHPRSVNMHSGHLHMQGSLIVKGDVERSFGVYATGNVEIRGSVDNGNVYAGGDVRVTQGIRGGSEGSVVCAEGNLFAHHAEAARLYAGRLLQIGEVTHSDLSAGRVEVSGKVRGGVMRAEFSVVVREAGAARAIDTVLMVAEPLEPPLETAQRLLERSKALRVARTSRGGSNHPGPMRAKGGKLGRAQATLQSAETERLAARAARREELGRVAFIEVHIAHPGVSLQVGAHQLHVGHELRNTRLSLDTKTGGLKTERIGK